MPFDREDLDLIHGAKTVRIETWRPGGEVHTTIVWAVVDGDDVYIRSWRGATARWFREARANPDVAIHVRASAAGGKRGADAKPRSDGERDPASASKTGGKSGTRRIPATAAHATDPDSVRRASAALERKYAGDPATPSMVRHEILDTTLRMEPRTESPEQ
jgi:hypothetical protein